MYLIPVEVRRARPAIGQLGQNLLRHVVRGHFVFLLVLLAANPNVKNSDELYCPQPNLGAKKKTHAGGGETN